MAFVLICSLNRVSVHARLPLLRCMAPADKLLLMQQYNIMLDCDHSTGMHQQPDCMSASPALNAHISRRALSLV